MWVAVNLNAGGPLSDSIIVYVFLRSFICLHYYLFALRLFICSEPTTDNRWMQSYCNSASRCWMLSLVLFVSLSPLYVCFALLYFLLHYRFVSFYVSYQLLKASFALHILLRSISHSVFHLRLISLSPSSSLITQSLIPILSFLSV